MDSPFVGDAMVTPLRAVIFDYGGVIRREDRADYAAIDDAHGFPRGTLWAAIHDVAEYRLSREGAVDRSVYRAAVRRALMENGGDGARADAALSALDRSGDAGTPRAPSCRRARQARSPVQRLPRRPLFDDTIISGDAGLAKPDARVFVLAAARLGVEPAACLMIDDQAQHVEGARAAGLRAHLHERTRLAELIARLETEGALG